MAKTAFTDHQRKDRIRKHWCKPLIRAISNHLNKKLIYIGLPDIQALDVLEWIDYIDRVIAFQCSVYNQIKIDVQVLDDLLEDLERRDKISSGMVYLGEMEDIVMGRLSERGDIYQQSDFMKIYNLDFCNSLTFPRKIVDERGRVKEVIYKTDVIEKFIEYQEVVNKQGKGEKFIMFLTINSSTFNQDLTSITDPTIKQYLKKINTLRKPEARDVRYMKAYCFYKLQEIFNNYRFNIEFLPPIHYFGSSYPNREKGGKLDMHRMMTFTMLGSKCPDGEALYQQDASKYLEEKFIFVTDTTISCFNDPSCENETEYNPNVEEVLKQSHTFQNIWT